MVPKCRVPGLPGRLHRVRATQDHGSDQVPQEIFIILGHEEFGNSNLHAMKRWVKITEEGPQQAFFLSSTEEGEGLRDEDRINQYEIPDELIASPP
jgi:hypothetical protein